MVESPETVHGRLLESVHLSGYSYQRACGELEWLLDGDRWKSVGGGFEDIDKFLATLNFAELKIAVEQRTKIVKRLAALRASQRATARMLGVVPATVREDLGLRGEGNPSPKTATHSKHERENDESEGNPSAVPWTQLDVDPSREAKRIANRQARPSRRADQLAAAVWPEGKYAVILADPPWQPDAGLLDPTRQIENQYPTATLAELLAMQPRVDALALDDCVLLLWTTAQKFAEATTLIDGWGFVVKSGAVWIKPSVGMGYWFRGRHELLILATRGNPPTPLEADRPDSVIEAPRRGHSEKPDEVYTLIERMFPRVPKVELFARARREGWAFATNETELRSA
jgi:N6-adenosine-specific RNA methylase IME4